MNITKVAATGLAVASSILITACAAATVDTASVEKNVRSTIDGPGSVKVDTVDCPENEVAEVGKTFTCSFDLTDGSSGEITVTVRDEDGAGRWEVTRPATGQAEELIRTGYEEKTGDKVKTVKCPDPLEVGGDGRSFCDVELENGRKGRALLTVSDGDMRWETK